MASTIKQTKWDFYGSSFNNNEGLAIFVSSGGGGGEERVCMSMDI